MAKPFSFQFSALGTQSWEVPADGILTAFNSGVTTGAGLSWNPSVVGTDYSAPSATKEDSTLIVWTAANFIPLFVPLSKGDLIFIFSRALGTVQVFFDDLS